jgi:hypothetical protein
MSPINFKITGESQVDKSPLSFKARGIPQGNYRTPKEFINLQQHKQEWQPTNPIGFNLSRGTTN